MKPLRPRFLSVAAAFFSLLGFGTGPVADGAPAAAARSPWLPYLKAIPLGEEPHDYDGTPLPPGPSLMPELVKTLTPADLNKTWKLRDGRTVEFTVAGSGFPPNGSLKPVRFTLYIRKKEGEQPVNLPVASLDPSEYPRVQRLAWHRYYEIKQIVVVKKPEAPKRERTVFDFPANGKMPEGTPFAGRPPGPEVAATAVAGLPVWPAMQKWKLRGGREVEFSLYGWHWRSSSEPVVDLEVLYPDTTACKVLPALDLDPAETDHVLRALWRRHYHAQALLAFPHPDPPANPWVSYDSVNELIRPICSGAMLPVPSLPLPGCRFLPELPVTPDRNDIPDLNQGEFGVLSNNCLPNSIAAYFLWWDATGWLPLGRKGTLEEKSEWLHNQMGSELRTLNNGGTGWGTVPKGLRDLSTRHLGGKYDFQLFADRDYRPANQARLAAGMNGVILNVAVYYGVREVDYHAMPLISASPDGTAIITTWGLRMHGRWKECDQPRKSGRSDKRALLPVYEFFPENRERLPKYFTQNNVRFILGKSPWDALYYIVPQQRLVPLTKSSKD